ncbi:predicted protein [Naegleria gruberi]|uniref:Predicted protein n=1 Tax=Naegleria gruberi TaxID=5762 RepID=D2VM25_NAEGR|nr:uncharacterized protein NAEGRDRAFT_69987 [Naegleria gruberi]EFC42154.1 predicted protein [Naegleria gruberi]|eukprot:XP_002674898.1 predicted protein [Naegleria gruberi strain NEG-M]
MVFQLFATTADNFNATNNQTSAICDASFFNSTWSREFPGRVDYSLCPDTWVALCLTFLLIYLSTIFSSGLGVIWKRNSGHIQARSPIYLFFTLFSAFIFIFGMTMRFIVGRKIFPCGLVTIFFFTFPQAVTLPTIFRLMRTFLMHKINLQKTKLFDVDVNKGQVRVDQSQSALSETMSKTELKLVDSDISSEMSLTNVELNEGNEDGDVSNSKIEFKNLSDVKKEMRKLNIYNFLISYKFITVVYILAFVFGILLWVLIGVVEEVVYQKDPTKGRIFLLEGGILLFEHGCGLSTNTTIIIGVESIAYIILELVFFILCLMADRDSWGIKKESLALIFFQIVAAVLFIVCGSINVIKNLVDYYVPYGFLIWGYMLLEVIVCVSLPVLYSIGKEKKHQESGDTGFERLLKNKKTFDIVLDFARRSYCTESVLCWRDIERYKKSGKGNRKKIALHIVEAYLSLEAPLELNMPKIQERKQELSAIIENGSLELDLFNGIQEHCLHDMIDLMDRLSSANKEISEILRNSK